MVWAKGWEGKGAEKPGPNRGSVSLFDCNGKTTTKQGFVGWGGGQSFSGVGGNPSPQGTPVLRGCVHPTKGGVLMCSEQWPKFHFRAKKPQDKVSGLRSGEAVEFIER